MCLLFCDKKQKKQLDDLNDDCLILLLTVASNGGRLCDLLPLRAVCRRWNATIGSIAARKRSAKLFFAYRWSPYKQLVDYVRYLQEFSLLGDGRLKLQGAGNDKDSGGSKKKVDFDFCDDIIVKSGTGGVYIETEMLHFLHRLLPNLQQLVLYVQLDSSPFDLSFLLGQWASSLTSLSLIGVVPSKRSLLCQLFTTIFSMQKLERLDYLLDEVSERGSSRHRRVLDTFIPDFLKDTIYEEDWMVAEPLEDEEEDDNNANFPTSSPMRLDELKKDILEMVGSTGLGKCHLPALKHFSTTRSTDIDGRMATVKAVLGLGPQQQNMKGPKDNNDNSKITTVSVLLNREHRTRAVSRGRVQTMDQLFRSPGRTLPLSSRLNVTGALTLQPELTSLTLQWPLNIDDLRYISTVFIRLESLSFSLCFTEMPISLERLLLALQPLRRLTALRIEDCNLLHICHSFKSEQLQYVSPFSLHHLPHSLITVHKLTIAFAPSYYKITKGLLAIFWELLAASFPQVQTIRLINLPCDQAHAVNIEQYFGGRSGTVAFPTLFLGSEEDDEEVKMISPKTTTDTGTCNCRRLETIEFNCTEEGSRNLRHYGVHQSIINAVHQRMAAREEKLEAHFKRLNLGLNGGQPIWTEESGSTSEEGEWNNVYPFE